MKKSNRRPRGAVGRTSLLLTLLLVAAVGMLVLPGVAGAVVPKKHARVYKAMVSATLRSKRIGVQSFNAFDEAVVDTAENIKEILAHDPVDHDALLNEEENAADHENTANGLIKEPEALQMQVDRIWTTCHRWFGRADRIKLKQGLHNVDAAADRIITAYMELASACDVLAVDPPDVEKAREHNDLAIAAVKAANLQFDKGFKQLRSLQR